MSIKEFKDSITIDMDNVNKAKEISWNVFGKYEAMNLLHGFITITNIALILFILHYFRVKFWGITF